jgi:hypothetical protein
MTTKHDAAKAIANIYVMRQQAAKNASSGAGRAFEAQQRRKQERLKAARKAEEVCRARKAPVLNTSAESEPPGTDSDPTE